MCIPWFPLYSVLCIIQIGGGGSIRYACAIQPIYDKSHVQFSVTPYTSLTTATQHLAADTEAQPLYHSHSIYQYSKNERKKTTPLLCVVYCILCECLLGG